MALISALRRQRLADLELEASMVHRAGQLSILSQTTLPRTPPKKMTSYLSAQNCM